jgi:hypothetical protein
VHRARRKGAARDPDLGVLEQLLAGLLTLPFDREGVREVFAPGGGERDSYEDCSEKKRKSTIGSLLFSWTAWEWERAVRDGPPAGRSSTSVAGLTASSPDAAG